MFLKHTTKAMGYQPAKADRREQWFATHFSWIWGSCAELGVGRRLFTLYHVCLGHTS